MTTDHPSQLTFDLGALGALAADDAARLDAHLRACERCRAVVARERAEHLRFVRDVLPRGPRPPDARTGPPDQMGELGRRRRRRWLVATPLLAAAAALLVYLDARRPDAADLVAKGGPALVAYARHAGEVHVVRDGETLHPGDQLRFAVVPDHRFLLIASIDGAGQVSVYFPFNGSESGAISTHVRTELPGAVTLDETLGPERVFALFSARPISSSIVAAALRDIGASPGSADAIRRARHLPVAADRQVSVLLEKTP